MNSFFPTFLFPSLNKLKKRNRNKLYQLQYLPSAILDQIHEFFTRFGLLEEPREIRRSSQ